VCLSHNVRHDAWESSRHVNRCICLGEYHGDLIQRLWCIYPGLNSLLLSCVFCFVHSEFYYSFYSFTGRSTRCLVLQQCLLALLVVWPSARPCKRRKLFPVKFHCREGAQCLTVHARWLAWVEREAARENGLLPADPTDVRPPCLCMDIIHMLQKL
jgi:hypothetical protein